MNFGEDMSESLCKAAVQAVSLIERSGHEAGIQIILPVVDMDFAAPEGNKGELLTGSNKALNVLAVDPPIIHKSPLVDDYAGD